MKFVGDGQLEKLRDHSIEWVIKGHRIPRMKGGNILCETDLQLDCSEVDWLYWEKGEIHLQSPGIIYDGGEVMSLRDRVDQWTPSISTLFFFNFFIFKLYIIVLVLPNIQMNPPQVYMCSPSWTLLPPPSPYHPSGSSQCTSPNCGVREDSWESLGLQGVPTSPS